MIADLPPGLPVLSTTGLGAVLRDRLAMGPISVADFMQLALGHPDFGYYRTRDPLGRQGDFITAPEISQMFGELVGIWCAHVWGLIGAPTPVRLVELGPGRGTLMADALRACRKVAARFVDAAQIHLVESSPALRAAQRAALPDTDITWHDSLASIPDDKPMLAIGNEFLDTLPIHQLVRTAEGWHERQIVLDADECLSYAVDCRPSSLITLLELASLSNVDEGSIVEISPSVRDFASKLGRRVARQGGAALLIDYGYAGPAIGDSLQAVRRHRYHSVLADPGEADLTAHVDFAAVALAAAQAGARVHGPVEQGTFLRRLGIVERSNSLMRGRDSGECAEIAETLHRLVDGDQMGQIFKAMALGPREIEHLPGFIP